MAHFISSMWFLYYDQHHTCSDLNAKVGFSSAVTVTKYKIPKINTKKYKDVTVALHWKPSY